MLLYLGNFRFQINHPFRNICSKRKINMYNNLWPTFYIRYKGNRWPHPWYPSWVDAVRNHSRRRNTWRQNHRWSSRSHRGRVGRFVNTRTHSVGTPVRLVCAAFEMALRKGTRWNRLGWPHSWNRKSVGLGSEGEKKKKGKENAYFQYIWKRHGRLISWLL